METGLYMYIHATVMELGPHKTILGMVWRTYGSVKVVEMDHLG